MSSKPSKNAAAKADIDGGSSKEALPNSDLPITPNRESKPGKNGASAAAEETKKQKIKPLPPPGADKKGKKEGKEDPSMASVVPTGADKNFDFTLNNGGHLEEIREQLKEESHILEEWESKQKPGALGTGQPNPPKNEAKP
jgi:hypothetical protein